MALNEEIITFLDEHITSRHSASQKVCQLIDLVFSAEGLHLTYGNSRTKTAIETFESGSGNCLSFTTMFVAMARHLDLQAYFQEVTDISTFERRGHVVFNNRHINVIVVVHGRNLEVDFFPYQERRQHVTRRISDKRALAHFLNNLGAEAFANASLGEALSYFQRALAQDSEFAHTWCNLGVAYRAVGELDAAEACYQKAMDLDRHQYTAMSNLAHLYVLQGRDEEAHVLEEAVERYRRRNPYYHYALGQEAFDEGRYEEALEHYKRARRRDPNQPEFHHGMAKTYYMIGDFKHAVRSLKKASERAGSESERQRFEKKVGFLLASR